MILEIVAWIWFFGAFYTLGYMYSFSRQNDFTLAGSIFLALFWWPAVLGTNTYFREKG